MMLYLQVTGKIDQYINTHYRSLAILSMAISAIYAIAQLIIWARADKEKEKHYHIDGHVHLMTWDQKFIAEVLLTLPFIFGMVFLTDSLDATIVNAKGFNFRLSQESTEDSEVSTQYLKQDMSIYFYSTDYNDNDR